MKIAIIGAGNIGKTLGQKWANGGHDIIYGVRDISENHESLTEHATVQTVVDAITASEIVLFAIPGSAMASLLQESGSALNGKIVIDVTNQMGRAITAGESAPQAMNAHALFETYTTGVSYYRAFNSLGWENFEKPTIAGQQVDLLYAGANDDNQEIVQQLIADIGLNPISVGGLDDLALVDNIALLWGALAYRQGKGRRLAFKVLMAE